jgi:hypothetical protein
MCASEVDALVGSTDKTCLSAASWSPELAPVIRSNGLVGMKFAAILALISEVLIVAFNYIMFASHLYST